MTQTLVEIADARTNTTLSYKPLAGVTYFKLAKASYSTPGSLELYCIVDEVLDADNISTSTPGRIQPGLQIRVSILDTTVTPASKFIVFVGRIDTAQQVDAPTSAPMSLAIADNSGTRQWHILARDWLAVLADNPVGPGFWRSAATTFGVLRNVPFPTTSVWDGDYVGDYTGQRPNAPGELRGFIVTDLVLNIVTLSTGGIDGAGNGLINFATSTAGAANSKPIVVNLSSLTQTSILDAIRDLLRSDPWWINHGTGALVDGYDIAAGGFDANAGFGSEIQILGAQRTDIDPKAALGRTVEYYRHGGVPSHFLYVYGSISSSGDLPFQLTSFITNYNFNRQGLDIYSRSRPVGQGDGSYDRPSIDGGEGVVLNSMETTWDPLNGNFAKRSEALNFSASQIGDWMYEENRTNEYDAIQARAQRDAGYADLVSGAAALSNGRGGLNQGSITIAGPPTDSSGEVNPITWALRPGETMTLIIPQLGIGVNGNPAGYTCQSWTYVWPDDVTTIDVARLPLASLGRQLIDIQRRLNESIAAHSKSYISQWRTIDGTGVMSWHHALGTKPGHIELEVAYWDQTSFTPGANPQPLPTTGTHVAPPATSWDAAQGQNFGYVITKATEQDVTVMVGYFVAYSDGAGQWIRRDDPKALVRVKVYPT